MWAVVINHLIQFPHALAWKLVRLGLEYALPEPSWEWNDAGRMVRLFIGEHSYEIERWDIRPDRLRVGTCLKQMDGFLVNLRSFLTCDSESCTCENQKGTDADGGSRTENGKGEKNPPKSTIFLPPIRTRSVCCWYPEKEDREAVLKILDQRQAATASPLAHDRQATPRTAPATSWPSWIPTQAHHISLTYFVNRLRATPWSPNSASLPWLLVGR